MGMRENEGEKTGLNLSFFPPSFLSLSLSITFFISLSAAVHYLFSSSTNDLFDPSLILDRLFAWRGENFI